jgi:hypothetical protein
VTNVSTWYLAGPLQRWLLRAVRRTAGTAQGLMWGKLVDVVLRLAPIFALVWLIRGTAWARCMSGKGT